MTDLNGAVLEVSIRQGVFIARLDARGCPPVNADVRADVNGATMTRDDASDAGFGIEARGCSGRWRLPATDLPKENLTVTLADASGKLVVETFPLAQRAGFKLISRATLTSAKPGETVFAEAHGPGAEKLARAEVALTTRRGDKLKVPATDVTIGGAKVGFTLPMSWESDGGPGGPIAGSLRISGETDAVVRCAGPARCAAPVRSMTEFSLRMAPLTTEASKPSPGQK